jgi:hypothetical protein
VLVREGGAVLEHLEVMIKAGLLHQVFVGPLFNYAPLTDDNDLICPSDRG